MNAQEKNQLFNLLKTASDNFYGYTSPEFSYSPEFIDDEKPVEEKIEQKQEQNIVSAAGIVVPAEENNSENSVPESVHNGITLEAVCEKISQCKKCALCNKRTHAVPGMGVPHPDVMVIGEGPGEEEDKQGLPFVGPAGQLLDKMLIAVNLSRNTNCYIANTVKCRPPYNRDPETDEAEACRAYLDAQIHILKPKMILALGKVALRNLLRIQGEFSLNKYRGQVFEYNGVPLVVTYHPSALLRNIEFKKPAWEDLKFFKSKLAEIK